MALASANRCLSTNSRTPYSHTWLRNPGSLYHHTIPAFSSSPAMALAVPRLNCPRWTVVMLSDRPIAPPSVLHTRRFASSILLLVGILVQPYHRMNTRFIDSITSGMVVQENGLDKRWRRLTRIGFLARLETARSQV